MERFARSLPRMRERTAADLARRGLVRDRVLACAVRLLDLGLLPDRQRALHGGERDLRARDPAPQAREDRAAASRASTTRRRGPSDHRQEIADPASCRRSASSRTATAAATSCSPTATGRSGWADVKAAEINEYLKEVIGGDYSAKDFRTWNATVLAAVDLATNGSEATGESARKRAAAAATKRVAAYLSNTPAVCRKAYIDPRVFDRYDSGETIRLSLRRMVAGTDPGEFVDRERIERAVLRLIR